MVKMAQGSRTTHEEDALSDNMSITGRMDPSEGTDLETAAARVTLAEVDLPEGIRDNLTIYLRLVRKVLKEYDPSLRDTFDALLKDAIAAHGDEAGETGCEDEAFVRLVSTIDEMPTEKATIIMRAFVAYFHLANICEENYRVSSLRSREHDVSVRADEDPINDITVAYHRLVDECGRGKALALLGRLEAGVEARARGVRAMLPSISGRALP